MASVDSTIQLIRIGEQTGASTCSAGLADDPWTHDAVPGYGPGASMLDVTPAGTPTQGVLPREYRNASPAELDLRIRAAKHALGERLVMLGHFYQRDEVVQYADFVGDSFQLAQAARTKPNAEAIVFCGVHFMAETADMLSRPEQAVILPNLAAGCSMADMADLDTVQDCWEQLEYVLGNAADEHGRVPVIQVSYMNSAAALNGFCGEHGGIVCTSSNATDVLHWAFARGQRVLFFPDQHLGRNTGYKMGIPLERMPVWQPEAHLGGLSEQALRDAKVLLWHGFCSVHKRFTVQQIAAARRGPPGERGVGPPGCARGVVRMRHPGIRVSVHPECTLEVVHAADENGSTDYIKKAIEAAPAGSSFAVGTEINLVQRLAHEHPEHTIFCLDSIVCPCSTMYRIHPSYLAWVLEALERGEVLNRITVPEEVAAPARVALERMLEVKPGSSKPLSLPQ